METEMPATLLMIMFALFFFAFVLFVWAGSYFAKRLGCTPVGIFLAIPIVLVAVAFFLENGIQKPLLATLSVLRLGAFNTLFFVGIPLALLALVGLCWSAIEHVKQNLHSIGSAGNDPFHRESPCKFCGKVIVTNRTGRCPKCGKDKPFPFADPPKN